jgi:hypothetical protein
MNWKNRWAFGRVVVSIFIMRGSTIDDEGHDISEIYAEPSLGKKVAFENDKTQFPCNTEKSKITSIRRRIAEKKLSSYSPLLR